MQRECKNCASREITQRPSGLFECLACGEVFEIIEVPIVEADAEIDENVENSKALLDQIRKMLFDYRNYEKAFILAEQNFLENPESDTAIPEFYYALCKKVYENDNNSINVYCDFVHKHLLTTILNLDSEMQLQVLNDAISIMDTVKETSVIREIVEASDVQEELQGKLHEQIKRIELALQQEGPRDVFVCYRSTDIEEVQKVVEYLEDDGISCWYSDRNLPSNYTSDYHSAINSKIAECKIFLFISSDAGKESKEIKREMEYAATLDNYKGKYKTRRIELNLGVTKRWAWLESFFDGIQFIDAVNKLQTALPTLSDRISDELYQCFSPEAEEVTSFSEISTEPEIPTETDYSYEDYTELDENPEDQETKTDEEQVSEYRVEEVLDDEDSDNLTSEQDEIGMQNSTTHYTGTTRKVLTTASGRRYEGETLDDIPHGLGVMIYENGDQYDGLWYKGLRNGYGKYVARRGDVYEGEWRNGKRHGQGDYYFSGGNSYHGDFVDDKFHGHGVLKYEADSKYLGQYSGTWEEGRKQGTGKMEWASGEEFDGHWENDIMKSLVDKLA